MTDHQGADDIKPEELSQEGSEDESDLAFMTDDGSVSVETGMETDETILNRGPTESGTLIRGNPDTTAAVRLRTVVSIIETYCLILIGIGVCVVCKRDMMFVMDC